VDDTLKVTSRRQRLSMFFTESETNQPSLPVFSVAPAERKAKKFW
jgi:hypothetical protein